MVSLAIKLEDDPRGDGDGANSDWEIDEDIFNRLSVMLQQEEFYLCHDYLQLLGEKVAATSKRDVVDETCRSKMCEWIFHVIDSTSLQRETASIAMGLLDRFLSTPSQRAEIARSNRKEFQLAAITCLYIAVKIREPFEMDAGLMSRLSRGIHSEEEITSLEYQILNALQWKVNGPTPFQFINHILELLPESVKTVAPILYEHSHLQTELAVEDYAFVPHLRPSTIAVAAILNSLGGIEHGAFHFNDCIQFTQAISTSLGIDIHSTIVNAVRGRLLESFAKSSGYDLSQGDMPIRTKNTPSKGTNTCEESPTCVSKEPL